MSSERASVARILTLSVNSSPNARGGSLLSFSACTTVATKSAFINCAAETFTATRSPSTPSSIQRLA